MGFRRHPSGAGIKQCPAKESALSRPPTLNFFEYALNMLRRCAPRQGTSLTRALSRPRSKWVPCNIVKACVFEYVRAPKMAQQAELSQRRDVESDVSILNVA